MAQSFLYYLGLMKIRFLLASFVAIAGAFGQDSLEPSAHALSTFVRERVGSNEVAGALAVMGNREGVLATSHAGHADIKGERKISPDTIFWIASMSKPVCGTAAMMAAEKGLISLQDPVSQYLPEFNALKGPDGEPAVITIAQCLSHTSGLQELTEQENAATNTLAALATAVVNKPLKFVPGTKWVYCQSSISVVARILEVVNGETYPEHLEKIIFRPLGMKDSTFYLNEEQLGRLALSYERQEDGSFKPVTPYFLSGKSPADTERYPRAGGGLYSTASDYGLFVRMILNGGKLNGHHFLKPESIEEMTRSHTGDLAAGFVPGSNYGLGWIRVAEPQGVTAPLSPGSFGHGGAYGTQAWIDPEKGRYAILMIQRSNLGNGDASETRGLFQKAAAR